MTQFSGTREESSTLALLFCRLHMSTLLGLAFLRYRERSNFRLQHHHGIFLGAVLHREHLRLDIGVLFVLGTLRLDEARRLGAFEGKLDFEFHEKSYFTCFSLSYN